jgi:hypothetical protein
MASSSSQRNGSLDADHFPTWTTPPASALSPPTKSVAHATIATTNEIRRVSTSREKVRAKVGIGCFLHGAEPGAGWVSTSRHSGEVQFTFRPKAMVARLVNS